MLRSYFTTAIRNLWRNKIYSAINILGLSIGLACCLLIFLYAKDESSYDRFQQKGNDLYRITATMKRQDGEVERTGSSGMMPGPSFKAAVPEIEEFVRVQEEAFTVRVGTQVFDQPAMAVDDNFFTLFSFPLINGNAATALKDIHSVVLSEEVARKYFGRKNPVGQVLELKTGEGFEPFTVSAVAGNAPQNSSLKLNMLLPMQFKIAQGADREWANFFLNTFVKLRPGADVSAVINKCNAVFLREAAQQLKEAEERFGFKDKISYGLQPFFEMHLSKDFPADNGLVNGSNALFSYILTGIAFFILLIACINFINLTVARSLKRSKEIGIRKVIGGQRSQLVVQFLGESFILSFIAFLFAILFVIMVLPFFNAVSGKVLSFSYLLDAKLVGGYIIIFIITGLLAGFYPALVLSGFRPVQTLYKRQHFTGRNLLSKSLVVLQFSLATFLIIATIVIYRQFNYLTNYNLGYNDKNVAIVNTGLFDRERLQLFRTELLKEPAIELVSARQGGDWFTHAHVNGEQDAAFDFKIVDEDFLPLLQIPVIQGRNFSRESISDTGRSALVNETFVKEAGWKAPVGETVDFFYNKKKYTVVGVVKDYHYGSLNNKIGPQVFLENPTYKYRDVFIKIKEGSTAPALKHMQAVFKSLQPFQPYQYKFADTENKRYYDAEGRWKQIVGFGAVLTVLISCIGLFGLATLSAEKRTKEIGIRKVFGASVAGIARQLSFDFLKLVVLSVLIASPLAGWVMHNWLQTYPYRSGISAWIFLLTLSTVVLIALATISFQSVKAALSNPVKSLRTE